MISLLTVLSVLIGESGDCYWYDFPVGCCVHDVFPSKSLDVQYAPLPIPYSASEKMSRGDRQVPWNGVKSSSWGNIDHLDYVFFKCSRSCFRGYAPYFYGSILLWSI